MAENSDGSFGEIERLENKELLDEFIEKNSLAEKLHFGEVDELGRFKQTMERLNEVERKLDLIIKHFKINYINCSYQNEGMTRKNDL